MSDDLVKRWDDYVESMGCVMGEVEHTAQQMRDRIEELEKELALLESSRTTLYQGWRISNHARIDAEAKLTKTMKALAELATDEHPQGWIAIATLAELKGQDDE